MHFAQATFGDLSVRTLTSGFCLGNSQRICTRYKGIPSPHWLGQGSGLRSMRSRDACSALAIPITLAPKQTRAPSRSGFQEAAPYTLPRRALWPACSLTQNGVIKRSVHGSWGKNPIPPLIAAASPRNPCGTHPVLGRERARKPAYGKQRDFYLFLSPKLAASHCSASEKAGPLLSAF